MSGNPGTAYAAWLIVYISFSIIIVYKKFNAEITLARPHSTQGKTVNKMGSLSFRLLGLGCTLGLLGFFPFVPK